MAFRKLRAKMYQGIVEYYNPKDKDKVTKAFYFSYRNEFKKAVKVKLKANTKEDALIEANKIRQVVKDCIRAFNEDSEKLERAKRTKSLLLNEVAELFFTDRKAKNNKLDKGVYKNRIKESLGKKRVAKITTKDILKLQEKLIGKFAPKTTNETINLLSVMFNHAVRNKWIEINPISRNESDKERFVQKEEVSTETGRVLQDTELNRLFTTLKDGDFDLGLAPNPRLYLYCKLLYFTGARPDAILTLKRSDYSTSKHTIRIKAMKLSRDYVQPLKDEVEVLIQEWIQEHNLAYDDYLFYPQQTYNNALFRKKSTTGIKQTHTRYEALRVSGRPVFDKLFNGDLPTHALKERVGFYSLRRTGATKIYNAKGLAHASKFLHHSDVRTTMKYLGIDDDLKGSIDVL
ncbi:tyrosine-type recombinase/integrase [Sulfurovum sp. CS9]|uniref:tyrosine-type recombinase/integrase n=1 Tax=Sulfurovum sp. CS9 TaxID=3391146 RepID=UPI0039EA500E